MEPEIECKECGWQGSIGELLCHPDDDDKSVFESRFVVCPECEAIDSCVDWEE